MVALLVDLLLEHGADGQNCCLTYVWGGRWKDKSAFPVNVHLALLLFPPALLKLAHPRQYLIMLLLEFLRLTLLML